MSVLNIRKAEREGSRLVIGIAGISGSGKTRTAIELAYGMVNYDAKKIGFLDTENRRGSLYANVLENHPTHPTRERFWIGDLYAPFSPQRYMDAILEFQAAGVEVLVIDSVSHEWNGMGGYLDMKAAAGPTGSLKVKPQHKRFVSVLLQSDMHVIVCVRATHKLDWTDKKNPRPLGFQPVQDDEFMFEMTASMMMWNEGQAQDVMKCPGDLQPFLGRGTGYITSADGAAIRAWVDGAKQLDPKVETARNTLRTVTEQGMTALVDAWKALPADIRKAISPAGTCPDEFKLAAQAFDAERAKDGARALDDLNSQVLGDGAAQDGTD